MIEIAPKEWGDFSHFQLLFDTKSPTTNVNIIPCDRPSLCWFNFRSLFGKTHPSSSDLEESWIFDQNHPVSRYLFVVKLKFLFTNRTLSLYGSHFYGYGPNSMLVLNISSCEPKQKLNAQKICVLCD